MELQSEKYFYHGVEYLVYSDGRIYGPSGAEISHRPNHDGYATVTLGSKKIGRKRAFVHRIVAELFLENPNNYSDVDHLDSNRMNPSVENLEWVTHQLNVQRAYERGGHNGRAVGERNPRAGLNDELVLLMRSLYKKGTTIQEMVEQYNFPWSTISNAVKGVTWKRRISLVH
ncbi:MAG: HNH endonuclease [Lachnospiraceae bacterium]|nr:HNH endonuclease [Lachnospiraceae bacterium]